MNEKKFQVGAKVVVKDGKKVLLLKSNSSITGQEYWDLPGGRFLEEDRDPVQCILREVNEELPGITNIKVTRILSSGRLPKDFPDGIGYFAVFYEVSATLSDPVELTDEHNEYVWLSRSEVEEIYNDPNRTLPFDDVFFEACMASFEK